VKLQKIGEKTQQLVVDKQH